MLLSLLDKHQARATFFVLGRLAEERPDAVRRVARAGHEIASHGYDHRFVTDLSREAFRADLERARSALEPLVDAPILGYRAPFFSVTDETPWALEEIVDAGFTYDSSIFPAWNPRYGVRDSPTKPHVRSTSRGDLWEVPVSVLEIGSKLRVPFAGGAYLRLLPWSAQRVAWRNTANRSGPLVAYLHPWELDPEHPVIQGHSRLTTFTHYYRLGVTARRLDALLGRYRFGRLDHVLGLRSELQPA